MDIKPILAGAMSQPGSRVTGRQNNDRIIPCQLLGLPRGMGKKPDKLVFVNSRRAGGKDVKGDAVGRARAEGILGVAGILGTGFA